MELIFFHHWGTTIARQHIPRSSFHFYRGPCVADPASVLRGYIGFWFKPLLFGITLFF